MKKRSVLILTLLLAALVLELLPWGVPLVFSDGVNVIRETASYFDMLPAGYGNFGPFVTAMLTCVMLAMTMVGLTGRNPVILKVLRGVAYVAVLASLLPLLLGFSCYSWIGAGISLVMGLICLILQPWWTAPGQKKNKEG